MSEHPLQGVMDIALQRIKEMVDSNTIIGNPITMADGTMILPVSKVSFGFASGGSDFPSKKAVDKSFFGGGAGAGVTINPVAFIAIHDGNIRLLQIDPCSSSLDRAINMVPDVVETVTGLLKKKDNSGQTEEK